MQPIATIILKSIVTAAIMLGYYVLALRNRKLHTYSRLYLMATLLASLIVPFLHLTWYQVSTSSATPVINMLEVLSRGGDESEVSHAATSTTGIAPFLLAVYAAISIMLIVLLVRKVAWVSKIARSHPATHRDLYTIIHTNLPKAPFSFMDRVYWNNGIDLESEAGRRILQHELVHIRQHHTVDKLFNELILAIGWINPFYWYIRHELAQVHEFLADEQSVAANDSSALAAMLLASHYKSDRHPVINQFFYSSIKRRIIMLDQTNKTRYALLRKAMILPLFVAPIMLFSFTVHKEAAEATQVAAGTTLVLDAGHGGRDEGATKGGVTEKELTLRVCRKMADLAPQYNIGIVLTRTGDEYPTLAERAKMGSDVKKGMFVSIHVNQRLKGFPVTNGWEVTVSGKNARFNDSKVLASAITSRLAAGGISAQITERGLIVLKENQLPAVLIECGNIDNAEDLARLQDDRQMEAMCRNILSGIAAYTTTAAGRK